MNTNEAQNILKIVFSVYKLENFETQAAIYLQLSCWGRGVTPDFVSDYNNRTMTSQVAKRLCNGIITCPQLVLFKISYVQVEKLFFLFSHKPAYYISILPLIYFKCFCYFSWLLLFVIYSICKCCPQQSRSCCTLGFSTWRII